MHGTGARISKSTRRARRALCARKQQTGRQVLATPMRSRHLVLPLEAAPPGRTGKTRPMGTERCVTCHDVIRYKCMSMATAPAAPEDPSPVLERAHPAARSDEAVLGAVYEERRAELYAFLVGMTHDADLAEDVLQDTFLRLIREARAGRMPDDVRPWLYRVAANAAIDRGRRGATLARLLPRLLDRREPARPEVEILRSERDAELHAALARLGSDRRAALLLAARGFSGHEVAGLLGRTDSATRTLLSRARLELLRILEAAEVRP